MNKFIGPLVEVSLHVRRGMLNLCLMEHDDELHQKGRSGHLLGFLVEECEDVALVVRNQAQPSTE